MIHEIDTNAKPGMGVVCTCGKRFPVPKAIEKHIEEENNKETESLDETPVEYQQDESEVQAAQSNSGDAGENNTTPVAPQAPSTPAVVEPKPEPKTHAIQATTGEVAKIATKEVAMELIKRNASRVLGGERAEEFFVQLGFLMRKTPQLTQCSPESLYAAMMQCINLDLMPGTPEGYCAIIPYGREAQFQLMYQGGMELAYRSGVVKTIKADLVFAEDDFDFDDATNFIHHKKNLTIDRTVAKDIIAAYAVAKLENGETAFVVMSPSEIAKIKRTVKANRPGTPWTDWEEKQVRKTVIKQLLKDLPGSRKDNRFKAAVAWDSANEGGRKMRADLEGNIIEGESVEVSVETKEAINKARTKEQLNAILQGLSVGERKQAAPLIQARLTETVK